MNRVGELLQIVLWSADVPRISRRLLPTFRREDPSK